MELAVYLGTLASHDPKVAKRRVTERARAKSRRTSPASRTPEWSRMAAAFPDAVMTDIERVH